MLDEHGLDSGRIPASGRGGRITKEDVIAFLESGPTSESASAGASAAIAPSASRASETGAQPLEERVKMSRMRRTIATRLKEAQDTAAILTTFNEADMSAVMALRKKHRDAFEEKHGVRLGFTSFFAKACVAALEEVPGVNATIEGKEIVYRRYYDIGMAVASPTGLVVPVIRDCAGKSFAEIEAELARLAGRANEGTLTTEEMTGGTFSITNGGVFGSLLSTPILNLPQSAILGLHKIEERPVAVEGEVVIRPMMYLALSYDHRLIDGREAVTFLVKIKEEIENPERLMLGL
jgi:2-oxoglutarate dehydrogenase E2 component (dihydrolipoamide succinyltransferase)